MTRGNVTSQGFSLLELLLSLLLTTLLVMGIAQYLLISSRVHLTLQQETLAARALESLLIQATFSQPSKDAIQAALSSKSCQNNASNLGLDFSTWCHALKNLPKLTVSSTTSSVSFEWQAPTGSRKIQGPALQVKGYP